MPLYASNFTANSLSGTVKVSGGTANIRLVVEPIAFEGTKQFVLKLRKDGTNGFVLGTTSNITIVDTSTILSVSANVSSVAEGNLVAFTITTANVPNNANVYFSVFPVTANVTADDFTANTGKITITNNAATFALRANADVSLMDETGETFQLQVRTNSPVGNIVYTTSNIAILDTYKTYNILRFAENVTSPIPEASNVTFTFFATNIPSGTVLYYNTTGNLTNFLSNTGSFVMNSTSNTFTITNPQVPANSSRSYNVVIRDGSAQGPVVATSNTIVVLDGGLVYMAATGGTITDSGGYRIHSFTSSGNLVITNAGLNPSYSTIEYLLVGGSGGSSGTPGTGQVGGGGGGGVLVGNVNLTTGTMAVQIGGAGAQGSYSAGTNGGNTSIAHPGIAYSIYALGGGGGGGGQYTPQIPGPGFPGGSGGGGVYGAPGGTAIKPSITNALSYGNPGGYGYNGWGGGGGGGASPNPAPASTPGGGTGVNAYNGGPAPARLANEGSGGYGFPAGPLGFPGGPYGAGIAGNGTQLETATGSIALIKYPYVAGASYTSLTSTRTFVIEGSNIVFTLNTVNLANNTMLYYTTVGNVISSDFVSGNTGSFRSTANATTITLRTNSNIPTNEERYFQLQVNADGIGETPAITSNVFTIKDTALYVPGPNIELLLVAGGGGGGNGGNWAAGGGAGGLLYYGANTTPKTPNGNLISLSTSTVYTVTLGGGGAVNTNGGNTFITDPDGTIVGGIAVGGGSGGAGAWSPVQAGNGGSGGGGSQNSAPGSVILGGYPGGTGITGQGFAGGSGYSPGPTGTVGTGGGGGASAVGTNGNNGVAGNGGAGIGYNLVGSMTYYAGGGAGQAYAPGGNFIGSGGTGGGGGQSTGGVNTGGGGGIVTAGGGAGYAGGPGVAIIRYPDTFANAISTTGNPNVIIYSGYKVYRFWQSGTITF